MTSIPAPILGYSVFANLEAPTFHHKLSVSAPLREPSFLLSTRTMAEGGVAVVFDKEEEDEEVSR
jgi:hypothetical protein